MTVLYLSGNGHFYVTWLREFIATHIASFTAKWIVVSDSCALDRLSHQVVYGYFIILWWYCIGTRVHPSGNSYIVIFKGCWRHKKIVPHHKYFSTQEAKHWSEQQERKIRRNSWDIDVLLSSITSHHHESFLLYGHVCNSGLVFPFSTRIHSSSISRLVSRRPYEEGLTAVSYWL